MADDVFGIVGTTQGAFKVERVVAEGGFGVVYRAYHEAFRAPVALKCLKVPGTMPEEQRGQFLDKFREEAELMFRLSAAIPAVVRPLHHDVLSTASGAFVPFIALEWLEGHTLAHHLGRRVQRRAGPMPLHEVVRVLTSVARALEAAHHFPGPAGPTCVVHRDLKPANIFLAEIHGTEVVKVLDFGIARALDTASLMVGQTATTGPGLATAFTPAYGAPEQWAPKRLGKTGPWTDVWGLALTFVEMLAGRAILAGDPIAIMGTVLDEKRRPTPRSEGIAVPDTLEIVFRRALALDPRARFQEMGAFWDEVELALDLPRTSPPIALPGRPAVRGSMTPPRSSPSRALAPAIVHRPGGIGAAPLELALPERGRQPPSERGLAVEPLFQPMALDWSHEPVAKPSRLPDRMAPPFVPGSARKKPGALEFMSMFGLPIRLAGAGVAITVIDQAIATLLFNGERLGIGPFRLLYVAVALVVAGIGIAVFRLFASER